MKTLILISSLILICNNAFATYYLVDKKGNVIDKQETAYTHLTGLESRNEIQIEGDDIPIKEAEYKNGKIKMYTKTNAEVDSQKIKNDRENENTIINTRIRKLAIDSLKAEGVVFNHVSQ